MKPSVQRRRLHLVYLLNDLLHHAKYHTSDRALQTNLSQSLQPYIEELLQLAAVDAKRGVSRRLRDLASIWEEENYFDRQDLTQLLDPSASTLPNSHAHPRQQAKSESTVKELPYILPSSHGDPSLPFYDLPAGNLVRLIVPNSSQPMRPEEVRPLQLASGPVDEGLVNALKDFLADVQGMENTRPKPEDGGVAPDMDEMGQMSYHDEAGGLAGDTYYGWSRSFCEKMKRRGRTEKDNSSRSSRSRSTSRSRSRISRKRRRYSESPNGRSRSSRSYSRSRSRQRGEENGRRGRSRSPVGGRTRSGPRSYPAEGGHHMIGQPRKFDAPNQFRDPPPVPPPPSLGLPFPPPPLQHGQIPIPPPLGWTGPWPPPPPPPPSYILSNPALPNLQFPPAPPNLPPPPGTWPPYPPGHQHGGKNEYTERR